MTVPEEVVDLAEVDADDAFLDALATADVETLGMLCELGGPLTSMLAAWVEDSRPADNS